MKMNLNKEVLNTQRTSRAWSQTQLADTTGLSLRSVQRIEKSGSASLESVKALASVYEISIDELKMQDKQEQTVDKSETKSVTFKVAALVIPVAILLLWSTHYFWKSDVVQTAIYVNQDKLDQYWIPTALAEKIEFPIRPNGAQTKGTKGIVKIKYHIDSNGKVSKPEIVNLIPKNVWDIGDLTVLTKLEYREAKLNSSSQPVITTMEMNYEF